MDSSAPSVHPQQALAVYAEPLVAGARVVVYGDASLGLGTRLVELGARSVQLIDPDASRARAEAERVPRGVSVHLYGDHDADARGFDLGLVVDLGSFEDPAAVVRRVRRAAGEDGVALIAAKSAEVAQPSGLRAFDYYDLFDLVAPEFESVRMVAQLPFHGVQLIELGEDDESPAVNVDTQLAESGRVPEAFIVVASQRGARIEACAIVQLPPPALPEIEAVDPDALARAELRGELLASQLDDLRARMEEGARAADELPALEEALRARTGRVAELEKALAARGRDVADLSNEVEEMRATAEAGRIAAAQVEDLALRADRAERRASALEGELASLLQELARKGDTHAVELARTDDSHAAELARVEEGLRERAQALRLLENELAIRDQMVRDLVGRLEDSHDTSPDAMTPSGPAPAYASDAPPGPERAELDAALERARAADGEMSSLRAQLDALALDLARREGEMQAAGWKVTELERQLALARDEARSQRADAPAPAGPSDFVTREQATQALDEALDEAEALRLALAQEHEARKRLESGEELARARAEIERQAVLLEQLARHARAGDGPPMGESGEFVAGGAGGAGGTGHAPPAPHEDSR
ncbi:MAG TPA: hypothetical protein VHV30_10660 [Polyangiaceae bacterium]|jgi:hypothetical protein|nr:hypothetical protein [Polyangiaceae bacterium]